MLASRGTVLIVEDTGSCATTLEIALAQIQGLGARVVSSAEEARAVLLGTTGVCAIITDVHLPQADGFELIAWVRQKQLFSLLPIIVISGDTNPETPARSLRLGADAYFAKPFSPSEVRHKLEDLINVRRHTPPLH